MRTLDFTSEELGQTPRLRVALITETWPPEVNGVAMTLRRMVDGLIARGHGVQLIRPRQTPSDTAAPDGALEEVLAHSLRLYPPIDMLNYAEVIAVGDAPPIAS